jgi:hypothetical protein
MSVASPPLDQVLAAMLDELDDYLPATVPNLPAPSLSVVSVNERPVGLGNRRGMETRGPFAVVELKGVRLEGVVRFQFWAVPADPNVAETAATNLSALLLADRDTLWNAGFLRLKLEAAPPAEFVTAANGWRKHVDCRVLFEYRYKDTDGAQSLIAQVPIHSDPEVRDSLQRETTVVSDEMIRWDDEEAPTLVVPGRMSVSRLFALVFFHGAVPTGTVTLRRTFDGASGGPTVYPTLADFLAVVAGPNPADCHAQFTFASVTGFLAGFTPTGDPLDLGDWDLDNTPDTYQAYELRFMPAVELADTADRFEIEHQNVALNQVGVMYLRATR